LTFGSLGQKRRFFIPFFLRGGNYICFLKSQRLSFYSARGAVKVLFSKRQRDAMCDAMAKLGDGDPFYILL
jgi:hypothetical protein